MKITGIIVLLSVCFTSFAQNVFDLTINGKYFNANGSVTISAFLANDNSAFSRIEFSKDSIIRIEKISDSLYEAGIHKIEYYRDFIKVDSVVYYRKSGYNYHDKKVAKYSYRNTGAEYELSKIVYKFKFRKITKRYKNGLLHGKYMNRNFCRVYLKGRYNMGRKEGKWKNNIGPMMGVFWYSDGELIKSREKGHVHRSIPQIEEMFGPQSPPTQNR